MIQIVVEGGVVVDVYVVNVSGEILKTLVQGEDYEVNDHDQ